MNDERMIKGSMAECFCNAQIYDFRGQTGKCKIISPVFQKFSWLKPHYCIGSSSWVLTILWLSFWEGTKIESLLQQVDELLQLAGDHWCGWNLWQLYDRKSSLHLDYWEPMPQYSMDPTTLDHRKNLNDDIYLPSWGIYIFLSIVLIWSIVLISGDKPPWMQRIVPLTRAPRGK